MNGSLLVAEGYPLVMLKADMCRLLNCHENTLYRRIEAGQVPAFRRIGDGKRPRYEWLRSDVERWLVTHGRALERAHSDSLKPSAAAPRVHSLHAETPCS